MLAAAVLSLTACSPDSPVHEAGAVETPTVTPRVDPATARPAVAALTMAPESATAMVVTDYDALRAEFGADHPSATPAELASFRRTASRQAPLLTRAGLTRRDAAWAARFLDRDGEEVGSVLALRRGAGVRTVVRGEVAEPVESWATDPGMVELVDVPALATYVERGCVPHDTGAPADTDGLHELAGFAVAFQGNVATARVEPDRSDLFARIVLGEEQPRFARLFQGGVADPSTGRIGYRTPDPAAAAEAALARVLPFAACAD